MRLFERFQFQPTMIHHIFVYGSLRSDASTSMRRLLGDSKLLGPATTRGKLYIVEGFPALEVDGDPEDIVIGELYQLPTEDGIGILEILDAYEGISPENPVTSLYRREVIRIKGYSGEVMAWSYVLNVEEENLEPIVSGDYVKWQRKGLTSG